jgi:hypothetical protein
MPLALLLAALAADPVQAVCPVPAPKACNEFFKSDAVLIGRVESERAIDEEGDFVAGWLYRVRVSRSLRGTPASSVEIFTENASARLRLSVGKDYILFASRGDAGRFDVDSCGSSGLVDAKADVIEMLKQIPSQPSSIEGEILHAGDRNGSGGIPQVRVRIEGEDGTVRLATSGADGTFRIEVPPGTYRVEPESEHLVRFDLSYGDPAHLVVEPGQCGQVALTGAR